ncbi:unnamed protein product [Polarella glacialis]|uniref:Uncharacterized protein n=1 Tax=Polarella glacialis TaxID=89957 RepID=A0A813I4S7_POLGL|nr:unnamed protein product [Polarella glacialis]
MAAAGAAVALRGLPSAELLLPRAARVLLPGGSPPSSAAFSKKAAAGATRAVLPAAAAAAGAAFRRAHRRGAATSACPFFQLNSSCAGRPWSSWSSCRATSSQASVAQGPETVLDFWFGAQQRAEDGRLSEEGYLEERGRIWFGGATPTDELAGFEPVVRLAGEGGLQGTGWNTRQGMLAQIILLDQLTREIWRGTADAFRFDERCCELAIEILAADGLDGWETAEAQFLLMPLMHSEVLSDHEQLEAALAVDAAQRRDRGLAPRLQGVGAFAASHQAVIRNFGRYPHRNSVLGRLSTPAELLWVEEAPGWARSQVGQTATAVQQPAVLEGFCDENQQAIVRLISLDCTGTLFEWSASIGELYSRAAARALRAAGFTEAVPDGEAVMAAFGPAFASTLACWPNFGYGKVTGKEFWARVARDAFQACHDAPWAHDDARFTVAFEEIYRTFQTQEAYRLFEDVLPFMHWASRKGYVLACVSNTTDSYRDSILPAMGLSGMIHFGIYSAVEGAEKPGAAFDLLLQRGQTAFLQQQQQQQQPEGLEGGELLLRPDQVLHIGDHWRKDGEGALSHGFHAALVDRSTTTTAAVDGDPSRPGAGKTVVRVSSLLEVRARLEQTGGRWVGLTETL